MSSERNLSNIEDLSQGLFLMIIFNDTLMIIAVIITIWYGTADIHQSENNRRTTLVYDNNVENAWHIERVIFLYYLLEGNESALVSN